LGKKFVTIQVNLPISLLIGGKGGAPRPAARSARGMP